MAKIAALALAASLLGGWEPANEGGEKHQKEEERGVWHLYTVADPFGDPEGWFAASPTVDGTGEVRFSCSTSGGFGVAGRPMLKAFAEGLGAEALDYGRLEAMAVHVRVDGGEADRVAGFRPNVLAMMEERPLDGYESGNDTVRMLQGGTEGRAQDRRPGGHPCQGNVDRRSRFPPRLRSDPHLRRVAGRLQGGFLVGDGTVRMEGEVA